jgi:hypothetical protein
VVSRAPSFLLEEEARCLTLPYCKGPLADVPGIKPETRSGNMQRISAVGVSLSGDLVNVADVMKRRRVSRGETAK